MSQTPIGAEARGRLRVWKRQALRRFERVRSVFDSDAFGAIGVDFRCKRGKGQQRALDKLKRLLAEARFIEARLRPAHVLWAILNPRGAVLLDGPGVTPGQLQDCVCVDFLAVGRLCQPDGTTRHDGRSGPGLWALEVSDHALGRLLQRDPAASIDDVIWQGHRGALDVSPGTADAGSFLLPAGRGCFVATMQLSIDRDTQLPMGHARAATWISHDMIQDGQESVLVREGDRMGDNLLLPASLRHLWRPAA